MHRQRYLTLMRETSHIYKIPIGLLGQQFVLDSPVHGQMNYAASLSRFGADQRLVSGRHAAGSRDTF
ncbi:uncharacterized [Tachysurus ichikawai]